jgi:hypothetical protein
VFTADYEVTVGFVSTAGFEKVLCPQLVMKGRKICVKSIKHLFLLIEIIIYMFNNHYDSGI